MIRFGALEPRLLLVILVALAPIVTLSCVKLVPSARQQRAELLGVGIALSLALGAGRCVHRGA